jgi:ABC-type multidrug transport system fused ATPase/permease subunit
MRMTRETADKWEHWRRKIQAGLDTTRLLYQMDRRAFLISTATGMIESLFYPLLLLIMWQGFSLLMARGGPRHGLFNYGVLLLAGLFVLLAIQHVLRIVNETATNILQAECSQQVNARIMGKMAEVPYYLFEENGFQARYGLLISQASYRPAMLVQHFRTSVTSLVMSLSVAITLLVLAPILIVFPPVLLPLTIIETRFHRRILELQTGSAPELFRMMYLSQRSIDATWQRDIRVYNSTIIDEEYHMLSQRYLSRLKQLLRRFQVIRLGVGMGAAAIVTLAAGAMFWLISKSPTGLAEAAILLPALYLGLNQGKAFSFAWGSLVECLGYIAQVVDFLNQSFEETESAPLEKTEPAPPLPATAAGGR